jgi:tetratricopeptide (TPR) repeat protein
VRGIRAKLGESLASIQKLAPLDYQVTTSSLEAFQAFNAGRHLFLENRFAEAVPLFQQAISLDPTFAMAFKFLASSLLQTGGPPQLIEEYVGRAYALRDRGSAYERFWLSESQMTRRSDEALKNLDLWART